MWTPQQWDQHHQEVREKDIAQARANAAADDYRRKNGGGSSGSDDGEGVGTLIIVGGYLAYKRQFRIRDK
ncbi:MAG: hypothetical protein RCO49_05335 [Rickettsia endosymbiont of Argas persicus]